MMDNLITKAHNDATQWARDLLTKDKNDWVILDTETTGLGHNDEIIQLSIINGAGESLISNQLVKPTCPISEGAHAVHGISAEALVSAPAFTELMPAIQGALYGKALVIYNASYDIRIITQSLLAHGVNIMYFELASTLGVNNITALWNNTAWFGEWNDYRGSFKWQRLPAGDHSSLGDCRSTLALIHKMASE
jgi:DNA polymerase-3 subunit epsilon